MKQMIQSSPLQSSSRPICWLGDGLQLTLAGVFQREMDLSVFRIGKQIRQERHDSSREIRVKEKLH